MSIGTSAGVSTTSKIGKANRPKKTASHGLGLTPKPEYPITDSFASKEVPPRSKRRDASCHRKSFAKR